MGDKLIQWRCKGRHKHCEGRDWHDYATIDSTGAKSFMKLRAPQDDLFEYRVRRPRMIKRLIPVLEAVTPSPVTCSATNLLLAV